jgi:hypothetical protein
MEILIITCACIHTEANECLDNSFLISIIIIAASIVDNVLLIKTLNVVMSAVKVATSSE